jgi:uncharacterized alkaline shock family protein YloU
MRNDLGTIRVSDEAIAEIAALAAKKIRGVAGMGAAGTASALASYLGLKSRSQGVSVEMGPREVALSIALVVEFGADVAETAALVQEAVVEAVERMTGLSVVAVDVVIQGVAPVQGPGKPR